MRRVWIGAGVAVLVVGGFIAFRHVGNKAVQNGVEDALSHLPPGYAATHGKTSYDAISGELTVRDFALSRLGTPLWSAGRVVVSGADQNALRDVFDPDAYPAGRPAWTDTRTLLAHFEADDVVVLSQDPDLQPVHIRRVSVDGLRGHPFSMPPTPQNRVLPRFQAEAALDLEAKSASLAGVALAAAAEASDPSTDQQKKLVPPQADHAEIETITLTDYASGKLGHFDLGNLSFQAADAKKAPVTATLAHLALERLDVQQPLRLLQSDTSPAAGSSAAQRADQKKKQQAEALTGIKLSAADASGLQISMVQGPLIALKSLHLAYQTGSGSKTTSSGVLRDFKVSLHDMVQSAASDHADQDTDASAGLPALVKAFGTDQVVLDIAIDASGDEEAHTITLDRYDYDLHDLGHLHMSAAVSAVPTAAQLRATDDPVARIGLFQQIMINRGSLVWEDHGLTNRLIAVAAVKGHTAPDVIRSQLTMPLAALAMMMPDQPDAGDQVGAFLADPKRLAISVAPPQPVSVAQVASAPLPERAHMLGLKIEGK